MKIACIFAVSLLFVSCNSKKEAEAEKRAEQTAKEWEEATGNLSETYQLPEVKPRRMSWGKADEAKSLHNDTGREEPQNE